MWKNYGLAAINVLISSLPLLAIWGPIVAPCYWLFSIALFALCSWNVIGDSIVTMVILNAKQLPSNMPIFVMIEDYFHSINESHQIQKVDPTIYYTNSKIPYLIPISTRTLVISLAFQDKLNHEGTSLLTQHISKETYKPQMIISKKVFLLSLISYIIMFRVIKFWVFLFFAVTKIIFVNSIFQDEVSNKSIYIDIKNCRIDDHSNVNIDASHNTVTNGGRIIDQVNLNKSSFSK